ncbi:MAG: protein kinase [Gemmataceae bacterium]
MSEKPTEVGSNTGNPAASELVTRSLRAEPVLGGSLPIPRIPGYEIVREIGRGGMGVVYEATQLRPLRPVALKMILAAAHARPHDVLRFLAEAETVAALIHPHIVQIYEVGQVGGLPFFSLEYCAGGNLARRLHNGPLPPQEAARLHELLARAVYAAHLHGIIHRDLKPANVLLASGRNELPMSSGMEHAHPPLAELIPKIADFGLAKRTGSSGGGLTQTGDVLGTPSFMAPEQANGRIKDIGPATDVYALGAVLYQCLTGRPPFLGASSAETVQQVLRDEPVSPTRLAPTIPRDLESVCLKCLEKEPGRRYATADALADDLRRFLDGRPTVARPVNIVGWAARWGRRNPALAGALAVAATGLVGGACLSTWFGLNAEWHAQRADAHAVQLAAEKEKLNATLSRTNFHLAQARRQEGRLAESNALLEAVRPEDRGFEWGYVQRLNRGGYATLSRQDASVADVAFSPDGRHVASASGSSIKIWDATSGTTLVTLVGHTARIGRVAFSPNGRQIVSGSDDKTLKLWDATTGTELATFRGHESFVSTVAFSPDGQRIVSGGFDKTVRVWDVATRSEVLAPLRPGHYVRSVAFSPDGRRIAAGGSGPKVRLWDVTTGQEVATLSDNTGTVRTLAFRPDGRWLATAGDDEVVVLWDLTTRSKVSTFRGHTDAVTTIAFAPDGHRIASASADHTVKVWDAVGGTEPVTLRGHTNVVSAVAFAPDGRRIASAGFDNAVKLWDAANDGETASLYCNADFVYTLAFAPDGRQVAAVGLVDRVSLWDAVACREVATLRGREAREAATRFGVERRPRVDDRDLAPNLTTALNSGLVSATAIAPVSRRVVLKEGDGGQTLWDAVRGVQIVALHGPTAFSRAPTFSQNGCRLATIGEDKVIRIWDAESGQELVALRGHVDRVAAVAFSPDGRRLASGSVDGDLRLWDVEAGQELARLRGHTHTILTVAFSPDGRRLASGSLDGVVHLWSCSDADDLDEWEVGMRACHAQINRRWHLRQATIATATNDAYSVAFHRSWVTTVSPEDPDAWARLEDACRRAETWKPLLEACDRVLAANPNNAAARRRRSAARGMFAAHIGAFASGWPGLTYFVEW